MFKPKGAQWLGFVGLIGADGLGVSGFLCLGRLFQGQPNEAALCFL